MWHVRTNGAIPEVRLVELGSRLHLSEANDHPADVSSFVETPEPWN